MLQTHERELQAGLSQAAQVNPLDLLGTNVPSISVRLNNAALKPLLQKKSGFNVHADDEILFKNVVNYINYHLQKEYPLYFLTVSVGKSNSITIKNAFHLLDSKQMIANEATNETDESDESDSKSLYETLHLEISEILNDILAQIANNSSLLTDFADKTAVSKGWNGFVDSREKSADHHRIADALEELNQELKMYLLDSEFLSVDRYNSNIPAIYFYDFQCRVICMFNLQSDRQTVESVVKACAAISCDGEAHGQLFFSKNAEICVVNGLPTPNEITEQYVRLAYKNEIFEWANQIRVALNKIDASQNFLMIEIQEIVVNRFYNGFVVGHFLSNERAYNASKMAVAPPKVNYK